MAIVETDTLVTLRIQPLLLINAHMLIMMRHVMQNA